MIIYFIVDRFDSVGTKLRTETTGKDFYVSGIYETGLEEIDRVLVLTDIRRIQKMNGWREDEVAGFEIAIKDYKKIDDIGYDVDKCVIHLLGAALVGVFLPEHRDISSDVTFAVMAIILVKFFGSGSARILFVASKPSISGICISIKTIS